MRSYYVYILANQRNGTLYVGVTNDLIRRIHEHREGSVAGFTKRYGVKRLVYFESWADVVGAIEREKRTKRWRRDWKVALRSEGHRHELQSIMRITYGVLCLKKQKPKQDT